MGHYYIDTGIGWYYLCKFFGGIGIEFRLFKTILTVLSLLLINSTLEHVSTIKDNKYIKNSFWLIYLIFPALLDCIQLRFLVSSSIFIYSSIYFYDKRFKSIIKLIILFIISVSIHSSCLFYVLVYLFSFSKKIVSIIPFLVSFLTIILLVNKNVVIKFISLFINDLRIERYFYGTNSTGIVGILLYSFLIFFCYEIIKNVCIKLEECKDKRALNYVETIRRFSFVIFLIIPLLTFDTNFVRLFRPIWVLQLIVMVLALCNHIRYVTPLKIKFNYFLILVFISLFCSFLFFILLL